MSDDREQKETVPAKDSEVKERETKQKKRKNDDYGDHEILDDLLYDPSQNQVILSESPTPSEAAAEQEQEQQEEKKEEESPPVTPRSIYKRRKKITDAPSPFTPPPSSTPIVNTFENDDDISGLNLDSNVPSYFGDQPADFSGFGFSGSQAASVSSATFSSSFASSNSENYLSAAPSAAVGLHNFEDDEDLLFNDFSSSSAASIASSGTLLDHLSAVASSASGPIEQLPPALLPFSAASSSRSIYNGPNVSPSSPSRLSPATLPSDSSSIASASILTPPKKG